MNKKLEQKYFTDYFQEKSRFQRLFSKDTHEVDILRYSYKLQMRDKWMLIKDYFTEEGLKEILEKIMIYPK